MILPPIFKAIGQTQAELHSLKVETLDACIRDPFQSHILQQLHDCDLGISRMKSLSRMFVWWLGFDQEVEEIGCHFDICQRSCAAASLGGATPTKIIIHYFTNI